MSLHNDLVLIKVFDKMEEELPYDKIVVSNKTHQVNINGKNKNLNKKIRTDFKMNYENFKSELEKYEITIFKINTNESVENQLMKVFGGR